MISSRISVIISNFNKAPFLPITLVSLLNQSYQDWECIIVDDNSTDESISVIEEFGRKDNRFIKVEKPDKNMKGASYCRNIGLQNAKGRYIQFFDSDDIMHPDFLKVRYDIIQREDADAVVCALKDFLGQPPLFDEINNTIVTSFSKIELLEKQLTGEINFYTPGPLWNIEFLRKNSLNFEEHFCHLEDLLFNYRATMASQKICWLNLPLIYYRRTETSLTGNYAKNSFKEIRDAFLVRKIIYNETKYYQLLNNRIIDALMKWQGHNLRKAALGKHRSLTWKIYKHISLLVTKRNLKYFFKISFGLPIVLISGKGYSLFNYE